MWVFCHLFPLLQINASPFSSALCFLESGNIYSLFFPLYMQMALTAHAFHHLFSSSSCFVFAWINNDMDLRLQVDIWCRVSGSLLKNRKSNSHHDEEQFVKSCNHALLLALQIMTSNLSTHFFSL
jgi:hypothetical protein